MPSTPLLLAGVLGLVVLKLLSSWSKKQKYLPGPPRLPFIGNMLQMPKSEAWLTYQKWSETYGDAVYLEILGSPLLVLNSYDSIVELFEKRSDIYSDRPLGMMANVLMGWVNFIIMAPQNDRWRRLRKMATTYIKKDAMKQFHPAQEREAGRFLDSLLREPEQFMVNFRLAVGRALLLNFYGIDVKDANHPVITTTTKAMGMGVYASQPGAFMIDFFPALVHVPKWFPGAGWWSFAEEGLQATNDMVNVPFNLTKKAMAEGTNVPSFTSMNLENGEDEDLVKWCSATMLSAGTDTSIATVHTFFLAMLLYPDVQKRVQAEIDNVCGGGRLPVATDRDNLPYLNAVMKEVMRWQPVTPLALPHRLSKDDVYKGCFIPAGTTVLANTWAVSQDPELFPNPEKFDPERYVPFFDSSVPMPEKPPVDPAVFAFGYGRRICSGLHYAEGTVFISMACVLATFDIRPAKDADGEDIIPPLKFGSKIAREVIDFPCSITPRSESAKSLIAEFSK